MSSVMSQAEVWVCGDLHILATLEQMHRFDVSITENVETENSSLNGKEVSIRKPQFSKKDLRVVDIVVKSDSEEK